MFSIEHMSLGRQTASRSSATEANRSTPNESTYAGSTGKYRLETAPSKKSAGFFRAVRDSFFTSSSKREESASTELKREDVELEDLRPEEQCSAIVESILRKHGLTKEMTNDLTARYKETFIAMRETLNSDKNPSLSDKPAVAARHLLAASMIYRYFPEHLIDALYQDINKAINKKFSLETANVETAKDWISSNKGGLR